MSRATVENSSPPPVEPGSADWSALDSEKRLRALLEISRRTQEYRDLDDLLRYLVEEIKERLDAESASVMLWDEDRNELFFRVVDASATEVDKKLKETRFPAGYGLAGHCLQSGETVLIPDVSQDPRFYGRVDAESGFVTRSLLYVPLAVQDRRLGVLGAVNKITGSFTEEDVSFLEMLSNTVGFSVENAKVSSRLEQSLADIRGLNEAKTKMIEHLAHELKTPLAVLASSMNLVQRPGWLEKPGRMKRLLERSLRNLDRLMAIEEAASDIAGRPDPVELALMDQLAIACQDLLETMVEEIASDRDVSESLRNRLTRRIHQVFISDGQIPASIDLRFWLEIFLEETERIRAERELELELELEDVPLIVVPENVLRKTIEGLIRNAYESTPDSGKIKITLSHARERVRLEVRDWGVGIPKESQEQLFHGFVHTCATEDYSTRRAWEFGAGGGGADLLRASLFAERFGFAISFASDQCRYTLGDQYCPGKIANCEPCRTVEDCWTNGGTAFVLEFNTGRSIGGGD